MAQASVCISLLDLYLDIYMSSQKQKKKGNIYASYKYSHPENEILCEININSIYFINPGNTFRFHIKTL